MSPSLTTLDRIADALGIELSLAKTDKTAVTRLLRIAWPTVGVIKRVVADGLDPHRLDGLTEIGVDEISWKRRHSHLTVVVDHATGGVIWTGPGKDAKALDAFVAELGTDRAAMLTAISMDMGKAYPKSARKKGHAPQAEICWDPFHVVALATKAMDFAGELAEAEVTRRLDRWCAWAQRSRLDAFDKLGRTIRAHRDGILAAIRLGLSNGKVEGRNAGIRLVARRAWGFHTAEAAAAMVMLTHGPITLTLPDER